MLNGFEGENCDRLENVWTHGSGGYRQYPQSSRESPDRQPDITDIPDPVKLDSLDISPLLIFVDILPPAEVAARLWVAEPWVYEKPRARCRNPMPCLRLRRYIRLERCGKLAYREVRAGNQCSEDKSSAKMEAGT